MWAALKIYNTEPIDVKIYNELCRGTTFIDDSLFGQAVYDILKQTIWFLKRMWGRVDWELKQKFGIKRVHKDQSFQL